MDTMLRLKNLFLIMNNHVINTAKICYHSVDSKDKKNYPEPQLLNPHSMHMLHPSVIIK